MEPVTIAPVHTSVDNADDTTDDEAATQARGRRKDAGSKRGAKGEKTGSATEKANLISHEDIVLASKSCFRLSATSPWFRFAMLSMLVRLVLTQTTVNGRHISQVSRS
jgi:hypothetical protein